MDHRGKPKKSKAAAKRPLVGKPRKDDRGKVRELEKPLLWLIARSPRFPMRTSSS
jgi:hypothetical protein